jgi:hypothetical protein
LFTLIWHLASEILIHYCDVRSSSSSKWAQALCAH